MGAEVTRRIDPGMGHLVNDDEIAFAQGLLDVVSRFNRKTCRSEFSKDIRNASSLETPSSKKCQNT